MLQHFLDFRFEVVTRALRVRAGASSSARIHILEGFAKVFDALDEMIRIIRKSDGKADAADKLIDALQARRRCRPTRSSS